MKTLILQLARLGDIYQTWPVLRALKRGAQAGDEFHFMTRDSFKAATEGLSEIDRLWTLDTKNVLEPVIRDRPEIKESLERLRAVVTAMKAENFDRIINLSYSPFSSRLTAAIAGPDTKVCGYSRHSDGFLAIPDDASAYFFAQVGPGRFNRVHLTDLFAQAAGVELQDIDWIKPPQFSNSDFSAAVQDVLDLSVRPIVVHLGASQESKTYGTHKWLQVIRGLMEQAKAPVVLIGSANEKHLALAVKSSSSGDAAIDLVGETQLRDLFALTAKACLVIGGDSAPMHVAALTGTPVLNLSFSAVSFWETGPKSPGSRILAFATPNDLASDVVVSEAISMLKNEPGDSRVVKVVGRTAPYEERVETGKVEWEWLTAIYMGQPFPLPGTSLAFEGLQRLFEANELALEQLAVIERRNGDQTALTILDRYDEIIEAIAGMVPEVGIIVRWFQTERVRLGPMESDALIGRTRALHHRFRDILSLYVDTVGANDNVELG